MPAKIREKERRGPPWPALTPPSPSCPPPLLLLRPSRPPSMEVHRAARLQQAREATMEVARGATTEEAREAKLEVARVAAVVLTLPARAPRPFFHLSTLARARHCPLPIAHCLALSVKGKPWSKIPT